MNEGRKKVNFPKFVRMWNENKSDVAIMSAMGWEPAKGSDPNKRIRATASFIRTKLGGKVKDEKTGETLKLESRERKPRKSANGKAKVAKVKVAKTKVKAAKAAKGRTSGKDLKFITVSGVGIIRSKDGELAAIKIRSLPKVVMPFEKAVELANEIEKLKSQPIVEETEAAEAAPEAAEAKTEAAPEAAEATEATEANTEAPATPDAPPAPENKPDEQYAA